MRVWGSTPDPMRRLDPMLLTTGSNAAIVMHGCMKDAHPTGALGPTFVISVINSEVKVKMQTSTFYSVLSLEQNAKLIDDTNNPQAMDII